MTFAGFSREALQFLADLAANNDRAWFQPRKATYERLLREPLQDLCVALGERFAARGIPLVADPARSPFRIYRDTRFSRDKSPYKTNVSASFPWQGGGPGGYFSLAPGEIVMGGGLYRPEPWRLAIWREVVAGRPGEVHATLEDEAFVRVFGEVYGDRLKRVPAGFAVDHPDAELLRLKDILVRRRLSDDDARSPALPDLLADGFAVAVPLFRLLGGGGGADAAIPTREA